MRYTNQDKGFDVLKQYGCSKAFPSELKFWSVFFQQPYIIITQVIFIFDQ